MTMNSFKNNILLFALIILIFSFQSFGKTNNDFIKLIEKGDSLYNKFNIESALEAYQKAYKIDSTNYFSMLNIIKVYNAVGEKHKWKDNPEQAQNYFEKAIALSTKLIKLFPDSSFAYTYLAISYGNLARFVGGKEKLIYAKKIEENAKHAIKLDPKNFLPYVILGAYFREIANLNWVERTFANILYGDVPDASFEDSEKMLKTALKLKPDIITANFQMALTYRAMGNAIMQKNYFEKVTQLPVYDFRDPHLKRRAERMLENF